MCGWEGKKGKDDIAQHESKNYCGYYCRCILVHSEMKGENGRAGSITSTITEICIACAFVSYLLLLKCISLLVWRMVFLVKYYIVFQLSGFRPLNSSFHFSLYFLCLVDSHSDMTRTLPPSYRQRERGLCS